MGDVARAFGAGENMRTYTRQQARSKASGKASSLRIVNVKEEDVDSEKTEEEIEGYKFSDGGDENIHDDDQGPPNRNRSPCRPTSVTKTVYMR